MMRIRLLLTCVVLVLLLASAAWFCWPAVPRHNINQEGFAQLRCGMTEPEVERVLGVPAGDYGPGKGELLDYGVFTMTSLEIRTAPNRRTWLAGSFAITVCFSDEGRVWGFMNDDAHRPYDTPLEMVSQALGLTAKKPYPGSTWNALKNGS
jgi:hypothetical protein